MMRKCDDPSDETSIKNENKVWNTNDSSACISLWEADEQNLYIQLCLRWSEVDREEEDLINSMDRTIFNFEHNRKFSLN